MTKNITFAILAKKLDDMHDELNRFISNIEDITTEGVKIIKRKNYSTDIKKEEFKKNFKNLTKNLEQFASEFRNFWSEASNLQRKFKKKEIVEDNPLVLKTFVNRARELNLTIEELESIFNYMRKNIKTPKMALDWWGTEVSLADIMRLSGKVLFVSREISKMSDN
jgi:hypothetical protein